MRVRVGTVFPYTGTVMESVKARFTGEGAETYEKRVFNKPQKLVETALSVLAVAFPNCDFKLSHDMKAGCTMCPCSPGFVVHATPKTPEAERALKAFKEEHTGSYWAGGKRRRKDAYSRYVFSEGKDGSVTSLHGDKVLNLALKAA